MAGEASAGGADNQVDVIGHVLDHDSLEVPFVNAQHIFDGHIDLRGLSEALGLSEPIFGIDMSITRHVVMMWLASGLLVLTMLACFRRPALVPSGLANLLETIVLFLRDEVVQPVMGEVGRAYLPFLLTVDDDAQTVTSWRADPLTATFTTDIPALQKVEEVVDALSEGDCIGAARAAGVPDRVLAILEKPSDERGSLEGPLLRSALEASGLAEKCADLMK